MRDIPVLKITLLLLHDIPVLNKTGPTHTQIHYIIFASFSTFEINMVSYEIFVYYSVFQKKITFDEVIKFVKDEQFKYLVLESINDKYYGFNLIMKFEKKTGKEIVLGNWTVLANADEFVIGWKVAKELPSWVNDAVAWEGFVVDIENHAAGSRGLPSPEESISDNKSFNSEWLLTHPYLIKYFLLILVQPSTPFLYWLHRTTSAPSILACRSWCGEPPNLRAPMFIMV